MSVIGFDIGNENLVVAAAKRGGIDVLLNDEAKRETPGVVSFGDKQRFLGSAGAAFATANPKSTISQVKRLIGRQYKDPSVLEDLKLLPFATSEGPRGGILIELEYMKEKMMFTPVEILGMLFKHLKQIAEKNLESAVVDCVIGIPSYFTDLQRREYLDAATIAGLKPLSLMHDGTAIALGYGMYKTDIDDEESIVVVFVDIGFSDTQVTVAEFEQRGMNILAHSFDHNLGGRDFDEVLFKHFAAQFKKEYNIDIYSNARACIRLRASCEKLKKVLSANTEAPLSIECLIEDKDVKGIITREEFENLSRQLLERVTVPCIKAVKDSGISPDDIYTIELVGSGSRIPAITKILTLLFEKEPTRTLNASECVARGCALRCAMLSPTLQVRDYEDSTYVSYCKQIQDVFPYSIALRQLDENENKPRPEIAICLKGSPFPQNYSYMFNMCTPTPFGFQVFYTNKTDFPAGMSLKVGHFMIGPCQSSGAEKLGAKFTLQLNKHGIVKLISVSLVEDKHPKNCVISNLLFSDNLDVATTKDELHEAQKRENFLAEQDIKVERIKDQRNTLESFVYDTRSKLSSAYRSFATNAEKEGITKSLQETEDWLYEDSDDDSDEQDYNGKLDDLKKLLGPIEKRYKDENARAKANKAVLTLIGEYRSAAELMPAASKHEVNNECDKDEKWFNNFVQQECFKNMDPEHWSNLIKNVMEIIQSTLEQVMSSKPSSPKDDVPVESEQRKHPVGSDQKDHPMDLDQMDHPVDSDQKEHPMDSDQKDHPMDSDQKDNPVDSDQKEHPLDSDQKDRPMDSKKRNHSVDMDQKDRPMDSRKRNHSVDVDQRNHPMDSKRRDHPLDLDQRDRPMNRSNRPMNLNTRDGHAYSVDMNQRNHPVDSKRRDHPVDLDQRHRPRNMSNGPMNTNTRDGHGYSNHRDGHVHSNRRDEHVYSSHQNGTGGWNQWDLSMGSGSSNRNWQGTNQRNRPAAFNQKIQRSNRSPDSAAHVSSQSNVPLGPGYDTMSVIGFDIGNENCVVAAAKRGGIDVLLNDEAKRETPGVVSFGDKQRFLGTTGAAFATANPKSTISQIKRLIGRQYKEPSVQEDLKFLPFVTKEGPRGGFDTMSVIGFDIGNESCVVAAAKRGGIDVLLNDEAKRETPGVVSFGDKQRFLGSTGAAFATANPKSTISQIKRLIGRQYKEPSVQEDLKFLPFVTKEGHRGGILIELEYMKEKMTFTPVEILGMLFKHLKQIAEKNLESAVVDCVIGIPSYFTDLQRREYLDAATIAGLKPLTLMHDGTAIALGYGMYKTDLDAEPIVVVFVDIGHSDTQVTVAEFEQGEMNILAHTYDQNLGGRDFDEVLFKHFAAQFKKEYNIDVYSNARACIRLRASCEKLKKVLSANTEAPLSIECLIEDKDVKGIITRKEFEDLSSELLDRVVVPCIKAVDESGISLDKIYTIELVGSGSRIPAITKFLTSIFQKEPTRTLNASECVVRGCALRCAMLSPTLQVRDYEVHDVFPYSMSLTIDQGEKEPLESTLLQKGNHFPSNYNLKYHGRTPLELKVFYTNTADLPAGLSPKVGHFSTTGPSSGAENVPAVLKFQLNKHGIFKIQSVSLLDKTNPTHKIYWAHPEKIGANSRVLNLQFSDDLDVTATKDELLKAQEREKLLAEQDRKVEQLKDQRNTLESFVYDTRSKISSAYRSFASDTEKNVITKSLQETEDWLYEDSDDESDEHDYTGKLDDLKKLLGPIEKRYKDEKARANATKELLTLIAKYRSATDSTPPRLKQEVNNFCDEAEKWLSDYQQHEFFKNMDPVQWLYIVKSKTEVFKSNCKSVLLKPSSPKRDGPLDSEQKKNPVNSEQRNNPVDSEQRNSPVDSKQRNNPVDSEQRNNPVDSEQRNHSVDSEQKSHPVNADQKDHQLVDSNRGDRPMNSNRNIDGPMNQNRSGGYTNSNQMGGHVYTYDWVSSHGAGPMSVSHGAATHGPEPCGPTHGHEPCGPTHGPEPVGPTHGHEP
ncbi:Heat shock protein 70 family [Artemisia annua]|uniref:Heat shock protein 70 family n=1 Tax=Artemisia annua TaxID=35608 RepID=A0A2U1QA33_ARTAN|nr:Heat shock protein 70 family [Artemisia annua]